MSDGPSPPLDVIEKWRDVPVPLAADQFAAAVGELRELLAFPLHPGEAAMARMVLGNLHRDHGLPDAAMEFYHEALEKSGDLPGGNRLQANLHANRGICLLTHAGDGQLQAALEDFDRAIALRRLAPLDGGNRWGLAASLMNRGDVLQRLGGNDHEARTAYDEAVEHLEILGPAESPAVRQRLALAWSNRGLVAEDPEQARRCFNRCLELLASPRNLPQLLTRGSALLNRGRQALSIEADATAAASDAREAMALLASFDREDAAAAEQSLHARHLLARALCTWLDGDRKTPDLTDDWIATATDTVEEALALERHWRRKGVAHLRSLALELFQLGLEVYRVCQPHFLAEFILESIDPEVSPGAPSDDPAFQQAAALALHRALNETAHRAAAATLDPAELEKQTAILHALRAADLRLAALQSGSL